MTVVTAVAVLAGVLVVATVLTASVAAMHFTAMAALVIVPDLMPVETGAILPRLVLAASITAVMLSILGFGVLALFADRTLRANAALRASQTALRVSEERLALAVDTDGLWDLTLTTGAMWLSERWQTMLGLFAVASCFDRRALRGGILAGITIALWLAISLEGLPMASAVAAVLAFRFLMARRDRDAFIRFRAFTLSLGCTGLLLFAATLRFNALLAEQWQQIRCVDQHGVTSPDDDQLALPHAADELGRLRRLELGVERLDLHAVEPPGHLAQPPCDIVGIGVGEFA